MPASWRRSALRAGGPGAWLLWLIVAAAAATGLRQYRVDNALTEWMPDLATAGPVSRYVLVGFPTDRVDPAIVRRALEEAPACDRCLGGAPPAADGVGPALDPRDLFVGPDGTYAGVYGFPAPGIDDATFVAEIRRVLRDTLGGRADDVALAGPAVFHVALNDASQRGLALIMALIVVTGFLLLGGTTRDLRAALAATGSICLAQVVLLGTVAHLGVPVDMSLSLVPPLMMALGFSYAAHRALRHDALPVLVLCGLTTAAGIGFFGITDLAPVRRFALWGVIGLGVVWAAVMMLVRPPVRESPTRSGHAGRDTAPAPGRPGWSYLVLLAAAVLSIAPVFASGRLRGESDPLGYFPADAAIVHDFTLLDQRLTGTLPFETAVEGNADPAPTLLATPGVRKVVDMSMLDPALAGTYWCLADGDALPALADARPRWRDWAAERGVRLDFRGVAAQLLHVGRTIRQIALLSIPSMLIVSGLCGLLVARRLDMAVAAIWVNALPIAALVAAAAALGVPLSLPALFVGAIAIGVGIDDTVHVLATARRRRSIGAAMRLCRRPCLGSSIVAAACLGLFALSDFRPTRQFGALMALAILVAAAADMLLLPILAARAWPDREGPASGPGD